MAPDDLPLEPLKFHRSDFIRFDPEPLYKDRGELIGDGKCGGKAKGLAFARAVVESSSLRDLVSFPGFSFSITTEAFFDFVEDNRLDWLYDDPSGADLESMAEALSVGEGLKRDLMRVLERAGGLPLAVRSSSLLEDSLSLSFAGKYETCFVAAGTPDQEGLNALEGAIKRVWLSLFNPSAKAYRAKHGMGDRMEAMGVLIQPVVGRRRGDLYYPELSGTVFSRVFRRPTPRVRKEDGVMRICFGLGTRTVERGNARVFYLTNPNLRPEGNTPEQIAQSSQWDFDYIDVARRAFLTGSLNNLFLKSILKNHRNAGAFIEKYSDGMLLSTLSETDGPSRPIFSFHGLPVRFRDLFDTVRRLMGLMEARMGCPVDMEFTYETEGGDMHLLQMRPLASFDEMAHVEIPSIRDDVVLLKGDRMVSNGVLEGVRHLVYVDAEAYMSNWDPARVAHAVGEMNARLKGEPYILVGPGRWGSSNPSLGVPASYAQICNCGCLVELSLPSYGMSPELSYGTHFFLDMDSDGILYLPVFDGQEGNRFNRRWFNSAPFEQGLHRAVRLYTGSFNVYLDGQGERGIVALASAD
ncbi:phosphoenolpyruvate synthase/pyruvate phosphate dikinase [Thermanaerovibrio velox DSM 12556]|uniref:Phosphoenolpyruvate synthase n=1 Tax=Thermanaerovibrio velox DSM 12556 TaxID=926567 RepID=H0UN53_9BACT|nr:PEP/pyruvate-binding domain-containing protein [Thermanaerovibrio velox]EHM09332.1 phosphoenolpyruvate synthase/pyruvate phosphate dikinase [Thermanaerovibrio velox DSM 12556]